ncbi:major outer membrane protein [Candidatus Marinarcus aquaticus]|uniref:Campylo_MOMP domain-containing protein n=1 Tax=Candidatus Marinarcus aquaticus TaxID=2044504 RepID=A0A4Q0XU51_9BACT|nr:major outer membrane protein [Candidatus Marinarcus aquaticus]RXJ57723.1 hypothetical protein CRV04_07890 [Candidatus Marinarcus aquaticus]
MKKIVKMSLVAAVAVAGLTTANAKPLEEAIKNVDVSGTVVYRYDDRDYNDEYSDKDLSNNKYKIGLNLKAKVNDDVTAVTRFIVGSQTNADFVSLNTTTDGGKDGQADVSLSNVYFSYTGIANTTVNVGKQGLTTPWTVAIDPDGNEQTGTGILALTTVGPVTLAGAYFNQTNLTDSADMTIQGGTANGLKLTDVLEGDRNIWTVAAIANVGPVALDAWYLEMQDTFDTFTLGASANFDFDAVKLSVGARHTMLDFDRELAGKALSKEDQSLTKIMLGLKAGIFGANVNYGWTDDEGGTAALDNDATTGMQGYTVQLNGVADAQYLQVSVDAQVLESLNIALKYHQLDKDKNDDHGRGTDLTDKELYLQATYKMSPNLSTYVRFGENEYEKENAKDQEGTIGRLQVQYSF